MQAELDFAVRIYAIATQGRNGHQDQWTTSYSLKYSASIPGLSWNDYKEDDEVKVASVATLHRTLLYRWSSTFEILLKLLFSCLTCKFNVHDYYISASLDVQRDVINIFRLASAWPLQAF